MISVSCSSSRPARGARQPPTSAQAASPRPAGRALRCRGAGGAGAASRCGGDGRGENGKGGAGRPRGEGKGEGGRTFEEDGGLDGLFDALLGRVVLGDDLLGDLLAQRRRRRLRRHLRAGIPAAVSPRRPRPTPGDEGERRPRNSMLFPSGAGRPPPGWRPLPPPMSPALGPAGAGGPSGPALPARPRPRRRHVKQAVDDGREIAWGSSSQSPTTPPPVGGPRPAAGRAARPVRASVRAALPAPAGPGAVSPARPPTARPRGTHRGASPGPVVLGRPLDLHLRGLLGRVHRRRRAPSAAARAGGGAEERGRAPPSARRPGARGPSERGASALGMQDQPAPQPPPPRRAPGPDRGGEGRGGRGRAGGPGAGGSPGVAHRGNLSAGRRGPGAGAAGG